MLRANGRKQHPRNSRPPGDTTRGPELEGGPTRGEAGDALSAHNDGAKLRRGVSEQRCGPRREAEGRRAAWATARGPPDQRGANRAERQLPALLREPAPDDGHQHRRGAVPGRFGGLVRDPSSSLSSIEICPPRRGSKSRSTTRGTSFAARSSGGRRSACSTRNSRFAGGISACSSSARTGA